MADQILMGAHFLSEYDLILRKETPSIRAYFGLIRVFVEQQILIIFMPIQFYGASNYTSNTVSTDAPHLSATMQ